MSSGKKKGRHGIIRIAGACNVHVECGGMTLYTVLICHFVLSTHCFNGFSRRYGLLSSVWLVGIMMFFRHKQVFYPQEPLHITNKNIISFIYIIVQSLVPSDCTVLLSQSSSLFCSRMIIQEWLETSFDRCHFGERFWSDLSFLARVRQKGSDKWSFLILLLGW